MSGDRIAVDKRRIALRRPIQQELLVEPPQTSAELDVKRPRTGRDDSPALAVDYAEPEVVALHDNAITDRERTARPLHLLPAESQQPAGASVEVIDVLPPASDHHR